MVTIEVFKTNVVSEGDAHKLTEIIVDQFPAYQINFDLHDCDHVMRVVCPFAKIQITALTTLAKEAGFTIEPLQDQVPA